MVEGADHDTLIRVETQMSTIVAQAAVNATQSVERDTRIEAKVDRINGSVMGLETRMQQVENWRGSPVSPEEATNVIKEHRLLMDDFKQRQQDKTDGRWRVPMLISLPPSLLAIATLAYLVAHNGF